MKTVILLDTDELRTLQVLLHNAKINLNNCDSSFDDHPTDKGGVE